MFKKIQFFSALLALGFIQTANAQDVVGETNGTVETEVVTTSGQNTEEPQTNVLQNLSNGSGVNTEVNPLPWKQEITGMRTPLEYATIREADVFWRKTVWRTLDMREKMNLPFSNPQKPFVNILVDAAQKGEAVIYAGNDDKFTAPIPFADAIAVLGGGGAGDSLDVMDPVTEMMVRVAAPPKEINFDDVKQFRIKEEWYFDKQTSKLNVRIMGICPIIDNRDEYGNFRATLPMFWIYFPEMRDVFVKTEAFNPFPDGIKLTWDDIFSMRLFSSYIYKEDNVRDYRISNYATGIDALYESERIKEKIFNFEHDLWSY